MPLDWSYVIERYRDGAQVESVPGAATLSVSGADEEKIYVSHRLWKASLGRENLTRAIDLVEKGELPRKAADFIDQYRVVIADERPTTAATVLKDLGYLD
jgi:hypothetical protein